MKLSPVLIFEKKLSVENELKTLVQEMAVTLGQDSVLLLSGDLGAGKTTTTRYICEHYGILLAQSPTYAIHQHYENAKVTIDHFDLYRMQNDDDLNSTGFWDLVHDGRGLVIIEWYEKINNEDWLSTEVEKRKVFGLKILIQAKSRVFKFYKLEPATGI